MKSYKKLALVFFVFLTINSFWAKDSEVQPVETTLPSILITEDPCVDCETSTLQKLAQEEGIEEKQCRTTRFKNWIVKHKIASGTIGLAALCLAIFTAHQFLNKPTSVPAPTAPTVVPTPPAAPTSPAAPTPPPAKTEEKIPEPLATPLDVQIRLKEFMNPWQDDFATAAKEFINKALAESKTDQDCLDRLKTLAKEEVSADEETSGALASWKGWTEDKAKFASGRLLFKQQLQIFLQQEVERNYTPRQKIWAKVQGFLVF